MTDQSSHEVGNLDGDTGPADAPGSGWRGLPLPMALVIGLPAGILGLWLVLGLMPWLLSSQPGAFGAAFGAVNALFSGLALAGVVVALVLQTRELQHLRQEIQRQRARLQESEAAWSQTVQAQRDSAEALKSQADSLLLASYLQAVSAVLDASAKGRQQKSVDTEQLDAVIQALKPQVDAIVGRGIETPAESDVAAESLEQAVRDFRGVLEAHPLRPGGEEAAEAVQAALKRLKEELLAVASGIEDLPFLEHAIGHAEELLDKSVPTDEALPEAENRLARYETAIIQMCSEVQRAAQDYRRQSAKDRGARSP